MKKRQDLLPILSAAKGGKRYSDFILSTKPLAYWPLDELSGSVAYDRSGNGFNGSYTGVTLGQPGQDGPCPYFDGSSDFVNVYSAGLAGAFNAAEGSVALWLKVTAAEWVDGITRRALSFRTDGSNQLVIQKQNTNNTLNFTFNAGGTSKAYDTTLSVTTWLHAAFTWSLSGNAGKCYINGAQVGSTLTSLGTWSGALGATTTVLGKLETGNYWKQYMQHAGLWTRALSATEINALYTRAGSVDSDYIAYDTFTRANGALGSTETLDPNGKGIAAKVWTGATWAVSSNAAINTPATLGGNVVSNNEFTSDLTGWTDNPGVDHAKVDSSADPGTASGGADNGVNKVTRNTAEGAGNYSGQTVNVSVGTWYRFDALVYSPSANTGTNVGQIKINNETGAVATNAENSWINIIQAYRAAGATSLVQLIVGGGNNGDVAYFDRVRVRPLTLSELFSSITASAANVTVEANLTRAAAPNTANPFGVVSRLDSASSPANFLLAYLFLNPATSTQYCRLDKCVGGTYTNLIDAAVAYSAGAQLMVIANGSSVSLYYNNAQVGTTQTVSDAGILNNTLHGKFSTYSGNILDNFGVRRHG